MPPVNEWASDAEYPPATSVGVDQSTKVEPSSGAKAQGFLPGRKITAQRLNWILNALCVLGNETEEDLGDLVEVVSDLSDLLAARSLQAAYARSIALGETTPHIDVGSSGFSIGGTDDAQILSVAGASGIVNAKTLSAGSASTIGALAAGGAFTAAAGLQASGGDISLGDLAQLAINAAADTLTLKLANLRLHGYGAGQRALIHNGSGVASDLPLESGTWTPAATSATGTGVDTGDLVQTSGTWARIGDVVLFTLHGTLNMGGWTGGGSQALQVPLPVPTTFSDTKHAVGSVTVNRATYMELCRCHAVVTTDCLALLMTVDASAIGNSTTFSVSGQYRVE